MVHVPHLLFMIATDVPVEHGDIFVGRENAHDIVAIAGKPFPVGRQTSPVDVVSTDRHTVKPWFQGKVPFTFNLPELGNSNFTLPGGRVTYLQQTPGAHLIFQVRKHEISVFIFQDRPETGRGMAALSRLSFNVATWQEGGLRYYVVGDASREDINALVELLKAAGRA